MAEYAPHNFKSGDTLFASQLNDIDDEIIINGRKISSANNEIDILNDMLSMGSEESVVQQPVSPTRTVAKSLFIPDRKTTYGNNIQFAHWYFNVIAGDTYYVTGTTPSNASTSSGHPLLAFFDADEKLISIDGTEPYTTYTDHEVIAPTGAVTMVVNKASNNIKKISVKVAVLMTKSALLNKLLTFSNTVQSKIADIEKELEGGEVTVGGIVTPTDIQPGIYNVNNKTSWGVSDPRYIHCFYSIEENKKYFITGCSATNTGDYPLCAFYDEAGFLLDAFGLDRAYHYYDYLVTAPQLATTLVVNRGFGTNSVIVKKGISSAGYTGNTQDIAETRSFNLDLAEAYIRLERRNPFKFKTFDKGYVTFIFDDLRNDLDSPASLFEQYNVPLVVAAIPDEFTEKCTFLQSARGNFTPGMYKKEVVDQIVANGGEVMAHNVEVITADNQYDYDTMYHYFCTTKQDLESAGYTVRGLIRAGGTGQIMANANITRWTEGNYEYSNFGLPDNHSWERIDIQKSQQELKNLILDAKTNNKWISFCAHDYTTGGGQTFTGEADLIELLEYCQSIGIPIVTCAYIFDHFGSSVFEEFMSSNG